MKNDTGKINWIDLTIPNAVEVKDFYSKVVGWKEEPLSMGEYDDYSMYPENGKEPVTGICHAQGVNSDLPAQWLIYILVENLEKSMDQCIKNGGEILAGPKELSKDSRYSIIKDPAGAVAAIYEEAS